MRRTGQILECQAVTGKGKGNKNGKGKWKATEGRKRKGKGKGKGKGKATENGKGNGKGNGTGEAIVQHAQGGNDISRAVAMQLPKVMNKADSDTKGYLEHVY